MLQNPAKFAQAVIFVMQSRTPIPLQKNRMFHVEQPIW